MKAARRIATALRIIGWVMVAVAVGVTIYGLATSGGPWNELNGWMNSMDVSQNALDRLKFDHQFYNALIDAADTKNMQESLRVESVRTKLHDWEETFDKALQNKLAEFTEEFYQQQNGMSKEDAAAFLELYQQMESGEETRLLKEAFEYLDSIAKPAAGKGKLAKLQAASVEPDVKAAYEALAAQQGEAAGEYLEYVEAVVAMIKEDIASGTAVSDVKAYVKNLDMDRFANALSAIQAQEREQAEDIREGYAELMEKVAAGEKADVRAYYETLYASLLARYPDEAAPDEDIFATKTYELLNNPEFDGSINTLMKEVRAANITAQETRTSGRMTMISSSLVKISDQNNDLGIFKVLWFLAANTIWVWVVAILLIVAAAVIDRIVSKVTLARLENAGIEEDPDILLRVDHLKQYFRSGDYINKAVDDVSFYIKKGEVFGLVGESGCGKTTTGRTIINLYDPTEGDVYFQGLRISSTQNGLPVLTRSLRNDFNAKKARMEAELKEKCAADPANKEALTAEYNAKIGEMKKELHKKLRDAKTVSLEPSEENSKCVEIYRE